MSMDYQNRCFLWFAVYDYEAMLKPLNFYDQLKTRWRTEGGETRQMVPCQTGGEARARALISASVLDADSSAQDGNHIWWEMLFTFWNESKLSLYLIL
jgi:hypothetical protein